MDTPRLEPQGDRDAAAPDARHVAERATLLPEEQAAGSELPAEQAALLLEESQDRTEHPDADASKQSGRRTSADAADPPS